MLSCNDDDGPAPFVPETIAEIASVSPDLENLVAALRRAGLVETLNGTGQFTVFAPTDAAFDEFLDGAALTDVPVDELRELLLNHVITGTLHSTSLETGYQSTLATKAGTDLNISMYVNVSTVVTLNGVSEVIIPNIEATNGIIHVVDAVIDLPNIVDHALANPNLTSLVGALTTGGNTTFTGLLSTPGDFTVFAPINEAFTSFTNPNSNALDDILYNHVVTGITAVSSGLSNTYEKTAAKFGDTDNNLSLYINTDDNMVTLNGGAEVVIADIISTNGVVHAVNQVIDIPTIVTFAVADPSFSTLATALTTLTPSTDFDAILSISNGTDPAPFTVFAPVNTAFDAIDIPTDEAVLADILRHHVVAGLNVTSGDLTNPGDTVAPSLEGDNLTITLPGTGDNIANLTDGSGNNDIGIVAVDVQAGNGVIHVINKVAIPNLTN